MISLLFKITCYYWVLQVEYASEMVLLWMRKMHENRMLKIGVILSWREEVLALPLQAWSPSSWLYWLDLPFQHWPLPSLPPAFCTKLSALKKEPEKKGWIMSFLSRSFERGSNLEAIWFIAEKSWNMQVKTLYKEGHFHCSSARQDCEVVPEIFPCRASLFSTRKASPFACL